jgi:hypothetical protein
MTASARARSKEYRQLWLEAGYPGNMGSAAERSAVQRTRRRASLPRAGRSADATGADDAGQV